MSPPADFFLAIPAYKESARLPRFLAALVEGLRDADYRCIIQVVDDGSGAEEQAALTALLATYPQTNPWMPPPILLPHNQGKGAAIKAAWTTGSAHRHLAFADADGAVGAGEVRRLFDWVHAQPTPSIVFASRIKMLGRHVERSHARHLVGRVFASLVGMSICPRIYDSQCGFKILPASSWAAIAGKVREDGFAFDVELLAVLLPGPVPIVEIPVDWYDQAGSRVRVVRDSIRMALAIRRIRHRHPRAQPISPES